ncbi:MAG: PHP domain-containing protein [Moraxella sp.]|uniref:PHP domain-containing protein n=1 Tax=Moraxella sp. TaxID=479 RepID=UPI0026DAF41B|nr:PHP domain-containing protein [Moraxella sp.]MDO4450207.1 PHP domain-containing protein [Moraxella sp.]
MKIDLHSHSTCSDGTLSPQELVSLAKEMGIEVFALTDHDTVAGVDLARQTADMLGIRLIHGVEISCEHALSGGYGKNQHAHKIIHVVALNFCDRNKMSEALKAVQDSRESRGRLMVQKLSEILVQTLEVDARNLQEQIWRLVLTKAGDNPKAVGRAHIAQVMYECGWVRTVQDAFDKYLADNKPAYAPIETLSIAQTIELIKACGGVAVLAHPTRYGLSATRVRKLIADFAMLGGQAVELPAVSEPTSIRAMIDRCVAQHGLMVSVGSDFHGSSMPWRKLGQVAVPKEGQVGVWERFA